jgi:hypothetical protein
MSITHTVDWIESIDRRGAAGYPDRDGTERSDRFAPKGDGASEGPGRRDDVRGGV